MSDWTPPDIAPPEQGHRRVVCAACRVHGGAFVLGARHWDWIMNDVLKAANGDFLRTHNPADQGFIDQWGRFMDRREAWKVAEAAGQILYRCGGDDADGGTLYSENLY